jgi:hypothetical protein
MVRTPPSEDDLDRLVRQAHFYFNQSDADAIQLALCVRDLRAADWGKRLSGEPRSWERFCRELLHCEVADLQEVLAGAAALQQAGLINPTVAQAREALRFEVDCEPEPPPSEIAPTETPATQRERLQADWLRLAEPERAAFLEWALAQYGARPKKPRGKRKG